MTTPTYTPTAPDATPYSSDLNWLTIAIIVEEEDGKEERQIASCQKLLCPRVGEYVWMPHNWDRRLEFATTAFLVTDVAHHISPALKGTYDNIVVYCKPVVRDAATNETTPRSI